MQVTPDQGPTDRLIDEISQRFEEAWLASRDTRIEDYLALAPETLHAELFEWLLGVETELRREAGEEVQRADYESRFPAYAALVDSVFTEGRFATPMDGTRFRIVRPLDKGNLGEVFVAIDRELEREVALKMIQEGKGDQGAGRQRFIREARITGALDHPGIIPVYGFGEDSRGRPFYAMRLIRRHTLKREAEIYHRDCGAGAVGLRGDLRFLNLLRRFLAVCEAMSYAHSRGFVHRDLKPSNIMLGDYGEALVVDWGLAKSVAAGGVPESDPGDEAQPWPTLGSATLSMPGSSIGTPAYMSPEQASGRNDEVGQASDIYSLGATLYFLLTGKAPFGVPDTNDPTLAERYLKELKERVCRGEFPTPRAIRTGIDRALEAICLKAMAIRPEGRYASARALAEELEHWLADEPISAWREPLPRRAYRWVRRHRTLATSAALGIVIGSLSLGVASALLATKNRELDRQRRNAEQRLDLAIEAVQKYRDTVEQDPRLQQADLRPLRKALLKEPMIFFRRLRDLLESDRETRADAQERLASAEFQLAYTTDEFGDIAAAMHSYEGSIAVFERLARDHPERPDYRSALAASLANLGVLQDHAGRDAEAGRSFERSIDLRERLARDHPERPDYLNEQARCLVNQGILQSRAGRDAEAGRSYARAVDLWDRLARDHPERPDYRNDLAISLINQGNLQSRAGRAAEAGRSYARAVDLWDRLARDHPERRDYRNDLARCLTSLGNLQAPAGRTAEAERSYTRAIDLLHRLARDQPEWTGYRDDLARCLNGLGILWLDVGRAAEAERSFERAIELRERLARDHPERPDYLNEQAESLHSLGILQARAGRAAEAERSYARAVDLWDRLARDHPERPGYRNDLAQCLTNLGNLRLEVGRAAEAVRSFERAIELHERLARDHPERPDYRSNVAASLHNLGVLQSDAGNHMEALTLYRRSVLLQRSALKALPRQPTFRQFLRNHLVGIERSSLALRLPAEAAEAAAERAVLMDGQPGELYNAACTFSLCAPLAATDVERDRYADRAMDTLRLAIAAGWSDWSHTALDPDLRPLHDRLDFQRLVFDRLLPADPFAR